MSPKDIAEETQNEEQNAAENEAEIKDVVLGEETENTEESPGEENVTDIEAADSEPTVQETTEPAKDTHGFDEISECQNEKTTKRDLDFLLDIPLEVSVEVGRTKLLINDLLQLGQGSVIELNKLAGEPMEILVNNKLIARGEVVVVNEKFGIRLTDIISPMERVQQLS